MKITRGEDYSLLFFKVSALALLMILVSLASHGGVAPFNYINKAFDDGKTLLFEVLQERSSLINWPLYSEAGVQMHDKEKAWKGINALQGIFSDGVGIKLVGMDGETLHSWDVDFFKAFPEPGHLYPERIIPKSPLHTHTQGMYLHRDGRALALIGDYGAVMLDKCSRVLWTIERMTHHSVTRVPGGYWVPAHRDVVDIPSELLLYDPKTGSPVTREDLAENLLTDGHGAYENLLLFINDQGEVTKEISVLENLVKGGYEDDLYDAMHIRSYDPTHVNDIEIVTAALAEKLPNVVKGDLLVSLRQLHMLAVFDQKTGEIKWHQKGPWVRQHDPDIMPNGNITVYNNGMRFLPQGGGSSIMEFDPASGEVTTIVPSKNKSTGFYSDIMGNHQLLDNGNLLITESRRGRVFEVDKAGDMVWSYVDRYDDQYASLIEIAERYPEDYFQVDSWSCD